MNRCKGCGIILQNTDINMPGYVNDINKEYCQRCFKITNYNDSKIASKKIDNNELIDKINECNMPTLFLVDMLNLNSKNIKLYESIKNEKMLVITKMDMIPKNIDLFKLEKRIISIYNVKDLIFYSSLNDFGKRHIIDYINYYHNVLIVGPTSSGKSTLINHLFNSNLTVSNYKNTTQDFITLNIDDNVIVDVPGFNDEDMIDNVKQKGFIKPVIMNMKKGYDLIINDYVISFNKDSNITLYLVNNTLIKTKKTLNSNTNKLNIKERSDLVINNLGFIYFKETNNITINKLDNIETRISIIGSTL